MTKTIKINQNEWRVLVACVDNALDTAGGDFGFSDEISRYVTDLSKQQVAGYLSQLDSKGLIECHEREKINDEHWVSQMSLRDDLREACYGGDCTTGESVVVKVLGTFKPVGIGEVRETPAKENEAAANDDRETKMFGCPVVDLEAMIESSPTPAAMMALSMLSDAQEEIVMGHAETARQTINRAKYIIGERLTARDSQGRAV